MLMPDGDGEFMVTWVDIPIKIVLFNNVIYENTVCMPATNGRLPTVEINIGAK